MTEAEHLQQRRELARAVQRLQHNSDWQKLRAKLFTMAPPLTFSFSSAGGYNSHGAAVDDGSKGITRYILSLELEDLGQEATTPPEPKADFVG